jgi:hypothetical protein
MLPAAPAPAGGAVDQQARATRVFRRVYTITFPHTTRARARTPASFSREDFASLVEQRHNEIFLAGENKVSEIMVFKEKHADGEQHIYAIVGADKPYGFNHIFHKLQTQDQVFCSYGSSHVYFWCAVVYASVPSLHKAAEEMDPEPYHNHGMTLRERLGNMPKGALLLLTPYLHFLFPLFLSSFRSSLQLSFIEIMLLMQVLFYDTKLQYRYEHKIKIASKLVQNKLKSFTVLIIIPRCSQS